MIFTYWCRDLPYILEIAEIFEVNRKLSTPQLSNEVIKWGTTHTPEEGHWAIVTVAVLELQKC